MGDMDKLTTKQLIRYLLRSGCEETNVLEVRYMTEPKEDRCYIYTDLSRLRFNNLFFQRTFKS